MDLISKAVHAAQEFDRREEEAYQAEMRVKRSQMYDLTCRYLTEYLPKVLGVELHDLNQQGYHIECKSFDERALAYIELENGLYLAATNFSYREGNERLYVSRTLDGWPGHTNTTNNWQAIYSLVDLGIEAQRQQDRTEKAEERAKLDEAFIYQP